MDNFIDKLAQKFSAQDMIRANLAAEAKETKKLRERMEGYENLLQEMRQVNMKNLESAERVNQMLSESQNADKEYLEEMKQEMKLLNVKSVECMEAAERVSQMLSEGARADMEYMQEMKALNLKSMECMETAERVNRMLQEGVHTDKEYLQDMFAKADQALHAENVKVYRNVQAAIQTGLEEQTKKLLEEQQVMLTRQLRLIEGVQKQLGILTEHTDSLESHIREQSEVSKKNGDFTKLLMVLILLGVFADVALQVMSIFGVFR